MQLVDWIVKQTGKISDNFNKYKFYVKQQPEIIDSSSVVSIHTFESRDMTATIPCSFKWSTVRNGLTTQIQHFKGNTFICQPADVGCLLQVQITSSDPECSGTALMKYGPVKFDVLLKKQIQMALSAGDSTFPIDISDGNTLKQCQIKVSQQKITILSLNQQVSFTFNYCINEPKLQVLHKISNKIRIVFNPKFYDDLQSFLMKLFCRQVPILEIQKNPFIEIGFNNRKARDSFIFITKGFNTKKQLKASSYVSILEKQIDFTTFQQKNDKVFDYVEEISQLQKDILKLMQINSKNYMEKRIYLQDNKKLQKEIQQIVSSYLKIIEEKFKDKEDFEKSFVVLKEKEEEIKNNKLERQNIFEYSAKIEKLQAENQQLKQKLSLLHKKEMFNQQNHGSQVAINSFKKKSFAQILKSEQILSFQELSHQNEQLKAQLQQISLKYQELQKNLQQVNKSKIYQINLKELQSAKRSSNFNMDLYDAKSVKSVKDKNHNESQNDSSFLLSKDSLIINPQRLKFEANHTQTPKTPSFPGTQSQIQMLKEQNSSLKEQVQSLQKKLQSQSSQFHQKQQKYKKRIIDLTEQLDMYKRNNDILNRSQYLSMEMEEYNQEQQEMLKKDNQFLKKELENYRQLCQKYIADAKKYKQLKKQSSKNTQILQEAGI